MVVRFSSFVYTRYRPSTVASLGPGSTLRYPDRPAATGPLFVYYRLSRPLVSSDGDAATPRGLRAFPPRVRFAPGRSLAAAPAAAPEPPAPVTGARGSRGAAGRGGVAHEVYMVP